MDKEARVQKLQEMREAREAKKRQMDALAAAAASSPAPGVGKTGQQDASAATPSVLAKVAKASGELPPLTIERELSSIEIIPVAPQETPVYDRETQTNQTFVYDEERPDPSTVVAKEAYDRLVASVTKKEDDDDDESFASRTASEMMLTYSDVSHQTTVQKKLGQSQKFVDFMVNARRVMVELLQDSPGLSNAIGRAAGSQQTEGPSTQLLKRAVMSHAATTRERVVTALSFEPHGSDLVAVAYSTASGFGVRQGPTGVVHVWSTRKYHHHAGFAVHTEPLFALHAPSEVHALLFNPACPSQLFGGTSTGQVLSWDIHKSQEPVTVSFPCPDSHTSAVFFLAIVGQTHNTSLVSVGHDNRMVMWQPTKPKHAQGRVDITVSQTRRGRINNAFAIPSTDTAKVFVGSADGTLFEGVRTGSARQVEIRKVQPAKGNHHEAAITSIHCHPPHSDARVANLVITAGMDWVCRVWLGAMCVKLERFSDFVYDVKWSPTNPVIFATADAAGHVSVWNIAESTDKPVATAEMAEHSDDGVGHSRASMSLTRLEWDHSGEFIIVGGSQGEVFLLAVASSIAHPSPSTAELFNEWMNRTFA